MIELMSSDVMQQAPLQMVYKNLDVTNAVKSSKMYNKIKH